MQRCPDWTPLVAEALSPDGIEALLSRRVPYVYVPRFLDPAWCEEVVRRFNAALDALPDHRGLVMGPAQVDALARPVEMFMDAADSEEYFTFVSADAPRVRALFAGGEDPLEKMRRVWQAGGWTEVPAAEDDQRRYHPDAVWGLRKAQAPPHVDAFERERPRALSRFDRHFNFNVYIQNPDAGGAFAVYNRYAVDPRTDPGSFKAVLDVAVLSETERLEHRPQPGDLVIFDAMLYHEVMPVEGDHKRRIQEHSNILLDPSTREFLCFA